MDVVSLFGNLSLGPSLCRDELGDVDGSDLRASQRLGRDLVA